MFSSMLGALLQIGGLGNSFPCLTQSYASREIKKGTIIAEDVLEFAEHQKRLLEFLTSGQ